MCTLCMTVPKDSFYFDNLSIHILCLFANPFVIQRLKSTKNIFNSIPLAANSTIDRVALFAKVATSMASDRQ